jgi:hypothetical protein
MRFKAEPNLYVRISNKYIQRATGKKGFYFDANGEYETENAVLAKALSPMFPTVEEEVEEVKPILSCKKCDFTCDNRGFLMAHYREFHPKKKEGNK